MGRERTLFDVLIVDDDLFVQRSLTRQLSAYCRVEVVSDAASGLALLATKSFVAVLTDQQMPGHNGSWLLGKVALRFPAVRRILYSSEVPPDLDRLLADGIVHQFCFKPTDLYELLRALVPAFNGIP